MYEPPQYPMSTPPPQAAPIYAPTLTQRAAASTSELDPVALWHAVLATLIRRRMLIGAIAGSLFVLVAIFTLLTPHRYTAEVKMIAGNAGAAASTGGAQSALPVLNALMAGSSAQSAETYAELIGESPVAQRVIDDLHLHTDAGTLAGAVSVKPVTNTNILALRVTWNDPETAARIANDFAAVFMARESELVSGQANGELDFLSKQLPAAEQRLREADTAVSRFQALHNIADLTSQTASTVANAAAIDSKIDQIQLERQQAQAQIASLGAQLGAIKPSSAGGQSVAENPVLPTLRAQLAQAQVQLGSAEQQYTSSHPTVVNLKNQIAELKREISTQPGTVVATTSTVANPVYSQDTQQLSNARATAASDDAQLRELQRQRTAINPQLAALPVQSAQLARLKREQKLAEDVYGALQTKYNDATVSRTTTLSDITVTEPASAALTTRTPHVTTNLLVGLIFGLLLGLGAAFLIDWFDGRIRSDSDIENDLGLPVLASVPILPSGGGSGSALALAKRNAAMESYYQLVLAMRYSSDRPLRAVTITSPLKGDGKSTIAMNVAAALGEIAVASIESEARILVIDADLRRPSQHVKFDLPNELGLSDILIGRASLVDAVQRTDRPGVDVLTSGTHSPNPIKLLQSSRFDALLSEARDRYLTVIVDAPALMPVFDAAIIAAKTDGAVMVLSANQTDMRATRKALARLDGVGVTDLIGTVMNRAPDPVDDYGDYFATAAPILKGSGRAPA